MHIVFLSSALPLTKTFVQRDGTLTSAPYPHVVRVTSHHEEVATIKQFHDALVAHAAQGHCLFGGKLQRPLLAESRAGLTDKKPREWIVFDFDKVEGKSPADVVKRYLPACAQNVSYVAQLSASMFRPDTTLWSGHIFMLLKTPTDEQRVKQWFEYLNFSNKNLEPQMRLSDSEMALHWPLDRTVAYASKLIYIAPPKCHGFEPAVDKAITLVKKKQDKLTIPDFLPIDSVTIRQKINERRSQIGLDPIDYQTSFFQGEEVLDKAEICDVHGIRTSGEHYLRFNLNGGDSYAYFIDLRNPEFIKNFKGEPWLKTSDAAPDLYKSLKKTAPRVVANAPLDEGTDVLAFYATNQSSAVKVGTYAAATRTLTLHKSTENAARAWLAEYGIALKSFLPHNELVFDPQSEVQFVPGLPIINTFRMSNYMAKEPASRSTSTLKEIPPVIRKTMYSMLGNPSDEVFTHFINWLAYIFKTRRKAETAWVLHGVEGSGKGSFVKHILRPLFGEEHVRAINFNLVTTNFNAFLESALFVVFEEADTRSVENRAELSAKLKHWITDSTIEINQKNVATYSVENFTNFLFFSNERTPVVVSSTDRRYNIAERQEQRLIYTPNEYTTLSSGVELDTFADVLHNWPIDENAVRQIIKTEAHKDIHEATTSLGQLIAEAILRGDLQFFIDRIPSQVEAATDFNNRFNMLGPFKGFLDTCLTAAENNEPMLLKDEQLFILFRTLIPDPRQFQDTPAWRKRYYKSLGLNPDKQVRIPGKWNKRGRGIIINWQNPDDRGDLATDETNVTPINRSKTL